jgi:hypothetical protein
MTYPGTQIMHMQSRRGRVVIVESGQLTLRIDPHEEKGADICAFQPDLVHQFGER